MALLKATYMIALDGVTRYSLEKATKLILQGSLGHAFMPSPPELRQQCDRIMQPHQDYLRGVEERSKRYIWPEKSLAPEDIPDAEAKARVKALWAKVKPTLQGIEPVKQAKPGELAYDPTPQRKYYIPPDWVDGEPLTITPALEKALRDKQWLEDWKP
jgi:hypothetical protein